MVLSPSFLRGGDSISDVRTFLLDLQKYINSKLYDTGWIDVSSIPGYHECYYRVKNGIVFVWASSNGGTSIGAYNVGRTLLGIIPRKYMPDKTIVVLGSMQTSTGYEVQFNIEVIDSNVMNSDCGIYGLTLQNNTNATYWKLFTSYPLTES